MKTSEQLRARLVMIATRLNSSMDDPDVSHRLRLLEPGIDQLEAVVAGLESKVAAVAHHRANPPKKVAPPIDNPNPGGPNVVAVAPKADENGVVVASATRKKSAKKQPH